METVPQYITTNGDEIRHPAEKLTVDGFRELVGEIGLDGASPRERLEELRTGTI